MKEESKICGIVIVITDTAIQHYVTYYKEYILLAKTNNLYLWNRNFTTQIVLKKILDGTKLSTTSLKLKENQQYFCAVISM